MARTVAEVLGKVLGPDVPVAIEAYDGSRMGPADSPATVVVRSPDAFWRVLTAPGELGLARAYVAGDLDLQGDLFALLELRHRLPALTPRHLAMLAAMVAGTGLRWPPAPPPEEVHLRGRRHSPARDAAAIAAHYDVSNAFYSLFLGPTMTYSCGVWADPSVGLDAAQEAKHDLICRKLELREGQRLLDVGCGWGSMVLHAAQHYGVRAVGVTISRRQAELAQERVAAAGLSDRVEIRVQDYRDVDDGPFDAISSIGMFEHVGERMLELYFARLHALLKPQGRLLNHAISRPPGGRARMAKRGFVDRYVFPDGELHEVGRVVSAMQRQGFEVRHLESLREHYVLTLKAWVGNLERNWDDAVDEAGAARARIWRLYMAGSAAGFDAGRIQVHQVLATRTEQGRSGMPLRPTWEASTVSR